MNTAHKRLAIQEVRIQEQMDRRPKSYPKISEEELRKVAKTVLAEEVRRADVYFTGVHYGLVELINPVAETDD
jgi:hypothetical protein